AVAQREDKEGQRQKAEEARGKALEEETKAKRAQERTQDVLYHVSIEKARLEYDASNIAGGGRPPRPLSGGPARLGVAFPQGAQPRRPVHAPGGTAAPGGPTAWRTAPTAG